MKCVDNLIIGGGIAGVYCAWRLAKQNKPFLLLEAQNRLGGRILSQKLNAADSDGAAQLAFDLGPTWYWPHQTKIQHLIDQLQLTRFEQYTHGDAIYQMQPDQTPVRSSGAGAMLSYRVVGGMGAIIHALADVIDQHSIKRSQWVHTIEHDEQQWLVTAVHQHHEHVYCAKNLFLALPPRMITKYLTPENYMSARLIGSLNNQQTWMSAQAKFVAIYDKPFWREKGLAGQAFSRIGPMVEIHDASASDSHGFALFGFIGIPFSTRTKLAKGVLEKSCVEQLGSLFGDQALHPNLSYLLDWAENPWIASAQDSLEPPRHPEFQWAKHKPELLGLNLYLAGSEFAEQEAGYIEGALNSVDHIFEQLD